MEIDVKRLIEAAEQADCQARPYSGRGMYGAQCVGLTSSQGGFSLGTRVAAEYAQLREQGADPEETLSDAMEDLEELARAVVYEDTLGRGVIVYFPGIPWPEDQEEDEDE